MLQSSLENSPGPGASKALLTLTMKKENDSKLPCAPSKFILVLLRNINLVCEPVKLAIINVSLDCEIYGGDRACLSSWRHTLSHTDKPVGHVWAVLLDTTVGSGQGYCQVQIANLIFITCLTT